MRLALLGYGQMGQVVDRLALSHNHEIVARFDIDGPEITEETLAKAEVCIDFSHPDAVLEHIGRVSKLRRDIVIGTTGWQSHYTAVKSLVESRHVGAIYAPNFSLGMALFRKVVEEAATLFGKIHHYDVAGYELHHNQKADSPSGSAEMLAQTICSVFPEKQAPQYTPAIGLIEPEALHFTSVRCGCIPGTHTIIFDSPFDSVELTHRARSREGFALGALVAAEWIHGRKGLFSLDDLVEALLQEGMRR